MISRGRISNTTNIQIQVNPKSQFPKFCFYGPFITGNQVTGIHLFLITSPGRLLVFLFSCPIKPHDVRKTKVKSWSLKFGVCLGFGIWSWDFSRYTSMYNQRELILDIVDQAHQISLSVAMGVDDVNMLYFSLPRDLSRPVITNLFCETHLTVSPIL